jgi:hypothetical protein
MSAGAWLAGAAALLTLAAQGSAAQASAVPAPRAGASGFAPPEADMLLTRRLERPLSDGKAIITERTYQVRIVRADQGFRVEGRLIDIRVDAPPQLGALADIERRRLDPGMFPVMLDGEGLIVQAGDSASGGSLDQAGAVAAAQLDAAGVSGADRQDAQAFIARLRGSPARVEWPADVFRPAVGVRRHKRVLPLPGGETGEATIEVRGARGDGRGELASLERVVTTRIGESHQISREAWRLELSPAQLGR